MSLERKEMSLDAFRKYPVWIWNDTEDALVPVENWKQLPNDDPLFIKAVFTGPDGAKYDGYLVGYEHYHAFGLFVGEEEYILNFTLPDMMADSIHAIGNQVGKNNLKLFPLEYLVETIFDGLPQIKGTFDPFC